MGAKGKKRKQPSVLQHCMPMLTKPAAACGKYADVLGKYCVGAREPRVCLQSGTHGTRRSLGGFPSQQFNHRDYRLEGVPRCGTVFTLELH